MDIVKARGPGVPKIQDSCSHLAETRGDPCTGSSARSSPDRVKVHFCSIEGGLELQPPCGEVFPRESMGKAGMQKLTQNTPALTEHHRLQGHSPR